MEVNPDGLPAGVPTPQFLSWDVCQTPGERIRRRPPQPGRDPSRALHSLLPSPRPPPESVAGRSREEPRAGSVVRRHSAQGLVAPRRLCVEDRMRPWPFPRPSHPLPASLLGQQRGFWKLGPFAPGPTSALLMWNGLWALPGHCLRWGREEARTGTPSTPAAPSPALGGLFHCPRHHMPPLPKQGFASQSQVLGLTGAPAGTGSVSRGYS